MMTATINLYEFDELNEKAQRKAIDDHRMWMLEDMQVSDYEGCGDPDMDTPESLYEADYIYILENDEGVIDSIYINDYLFFQDGEWAQAVRYYGAHPLAGKTILRVNGQTVEARPAQRPETISA